ncbi:MAG: DUF835 domain-containing protein [Thermoplasmata archaeon]
MNDKYRKSEDYIYGYIDGMEDILKEIKKGSSSSLTLTELKIMVESVIKSREKELMPILKGSVPTKKETKAIPNLDFGNIYFVVEPNPDYSIEIVEHLLNGDDLKFICVYRKIAYVQPLIDKWKTVTHTIRLSTKSGGEDIAPIGMVGLDRNANNMQSTDLEQVISNIVEILSDNKENKYLIYLQGIEFLSSYNDKEKIIKFLNSIKDSISTLRAYMLVTIDKDYYSSNDFAQISKTADDLIFKNM